MNELDQNRDQVKHAKDIIIGSARVVWCSINKAWALPGGIFTSIESKAITVAVNMNQMVRLVK
jgi:hypothetical protein